jgi:hypothetical protein
MLLRLFGVDAPYGPEVMYGKRCQINLIVVVLMPSVLMVQGEGRGDTIGEALW